MHRIFPLIRNVVLYRMQFKLPIYPSTPRFLASRTTTARPEIPKHLLDTTRTPSEILANLPPEDVDRLEFAKTEHKYFLEAGHHVPSEMTDKYWLELLLCPTYTQRRKYYRYLVQKLARRAADDERKKERNIELTKRIEMSENKPYVPRNCILRRLHDRDMAKMENTRIFNSVMWGQPIIFDLAYEDLMRIQDVNNLFKQLTYVFCHNRQSLDPFHLIFTNLKHGSLQYKSFCKNFSASDSQFNCLENFPFTVSEENYMSLFPDKRLVHLTPDAPRMLADGEWDNDAIYIIGGLIDKAIRQPVTFAKAQREGIEYRRLPLERYLKWKAGSKTLTLDAMFNILLTAKDTRGDWDQAMKHVPRRHVKELQTPKDNLYKTVLEFGQDWRDQKRLKKTMTKMKKYEEYQ